MLFIPKDKIEKFYNDIKSKYNNKTFDNFINIYIDSYLLNIMGKNIYGIIIIYLMVIILLNINI